MDATEKLEELEPCLICGEPGCEGGCFYAEDEDDFPIVEIGRCGNCREPIYYGDTYYVVGKMNLKDGAVDESMVCSISCVPEEYGYRKVDENEVESGE